MTDVIYVPGAGCNLFSPGMAVVLDGYSRFVKTYPLKSKDEITVKCPHKGVHRLDRTEKMPACYFSRCH